MWARKTTKEGAKWARKTTKDGAMWARKTTKEGAMWVRWGHSSPAGARARGATRATHSVRTLGLDTDTVTNQTQEAQ
eukprot:1654707-Pyramimonas_sp.AAC.1